MITIDSCSTQDVDRLLGLADQFLDDWSEDAVQGGKPDEDYEERSSEWKIMRPLLVAAPKLFRALKEIASLCRGSAAPMALHCAGIIRSSTDGLVSDERISQTSSVPQNASAERAYLEASGKIVDSIRYAEEASGWPAFEVRFTDGTFMFVEPVPRVHLQVRYLRTSDGNIETLRDDGTSS
jgi:hypothetical protein